MRTQAQLRSCILAAGLLVAGGLPGFAQEEKPVTLTGVFTTGYYTTSNENGRVVRVSSVPVILNLDLGGFLGHPDFFSYRVQPQLSTGASASEAGFISGNGVTLNANFLRRRSFPLTLTYSNVQREQLTYGSLTRVSGLTSVTHKRDFGLNWQLRHPKLPHVTLDLGWSRDTLDPEEAIIPEYESRSRQYSLNLNDQLWGWTLDGSLRWNRFSSDFANPLEPEIVTVELGRRSANYQFTAQRALWGRSRLVLSGGLLDSRNTFNDRPFDQEVRYLNGQLNFAWGKRWHGGFRASYNTNLLGTEIEEALSQFPGPGGSGAPGSGTSVFIPFQTRVSSLSVSGNVRFQAHRDWSFFGSLSRDDVSTPDGIVAANDADYLTGSGGVSFQRSFSWASLTSHYTLNLGRMTFANIPDSRILGHAFSVIAQRGSVERLELTASFNASTQRVDQTIALRTGNLSTEFSLGRRWAGLVFRGGLGLQRSSFRDGGLDYQANGLTFRASVEHRRMQLSYFRNAVDGNTFQPVLLGAPLQTILSATRSQTLGLRASPWRRLEANLSWTQGQQRFDHQVNNDYDQFDLRVGYRFRLLTFDVGYARYEQKFLTFAGYMRSRLYFRVSRPFQVF